MIKNPDYLQKNRLRSQGKLVKINDDFDLPTSFTERIQSLKNTRGTFSTSDIVYMGIHRLNFSLSNPSYNNYNATSRTLRTSKSSIWGQPNKSFGF
jgi:hypothetical protein